jgi:hypothetical protein
LWAGLEQLPPFESYQMDRGSCAAAACGRTYRYMDAAPLFHFGSGTPYAGCAHARMLLLLLLLLLCAAALRCRDDPTPRHARLGVCAQPA